MIFALAGAILGILFGIWRAKKAGGNALDMAQYAAVYAMLFGLVGVIVTVILVRSA